MRQAQSIAGNNNLYPRTKNVHRYATRGEKREGERERERNVVEITVFC